MVVSFETDDARRELRAKRLRLIQALAEVNAQLLLIDEFERLAKEGAHALHPAGIPTDRLDRAGDD